MWQSAWLGNWWGLWFLANTLLSPYYMDPYRAAPASGADDPFDVDPGAATLAD
jgi:hypothetical protein